jgi:hypothetical protein
MSEERFIKATQPIRVELNGREYLVKPLSFKTHIAIQRELRKSFADGLTAEQKEDAYVSAITMLAEALQLPTDDVLNTDSEFVSKLIDVFLLQTR